MQKISFSKPISREKKEKENTDSLDCELGSTKSELHPSCE